MVLNPLMAVPFITVPLVQVAVAYGAMAIGLVPRLSGVQVPFGMPVVASGFIAGGWRVALLQIALVAIGCVIYLPFLKKADGMAVKEEQQEQNE